jgi:hypothetical protein
MPLRLALGTLRATREGEVAEPELYGLSISCGPALPLLLDPVYCIGRIGRVGHAGRTCKAGSMRMCTTKGYIVLGVHTYLVWLTVAKAT